MATPDTIRKRLEMRGFTGHFCTPSLIYRALFGPSPAAQV
jgi:hypothetical protein